MMLAIIVLVIATMSIALFTSQVVNQIKFTKRTEDSMVSKYEIDGGIEVAVSNLLEAIKVEVEERQAHDGIDKYTIKTIKIDYSSLYTDSNISYLKDKNYDISIDANLINSRSKYSEDTKVINKSKNMVIHQTVIELGRNESSLGEFNLNYNIKIKSNKSNTKDKKFNVIIKLNNITGGDSYGISYEVSEI